MVLGGREDRGEALDERARVGVGHAIAGEVPQPEPPELGDPRGDRIVGPDGVRLGLVVERDRVGERPRLHPGLRGSRQQARPGRVVVGERARRAAEQVRRRGHVAATERAKAGRREAVGGATSEPDGLGIHGPQPGPQVVGLLEVIAEDLVHLGPPSGRARERLEPVREAEVQRRAGPLEQPVVHDVTQQQVPEPMVRERVGVARPGDQLAADERAEHRVRLDRRVEEAVDRGLREVAADDRCRLEDLALLRPERIDAGGQDGFDGRWHLHALDVGGHEPGAVPFDQEALVDEHRQELLDEQRVPGRRLLDPGHERRRQRGVTERGRDDLVVRAVLEGPELEHPRRRGRPDRRPRSAGAIGLRRAFHRDQEDRSIAQVLVEVVEQLEERRLGPVQAIDDHDQRRGLPRGDRGAGGRPRPAPAPGTGGRSGRRSTTAARRPSRRPGAAPRSPRGRSRRDRSGRRRTPPG